MVGTSRSPTPRRSRASHRWPANRPDRLDGPRDPEPARSCPLDLAREFAGFSLSCGDRLPRATRLRARKRPLAEPQSDPSRDPERAARARALTRPFRALLSGDPGAGVVASRRTQRSRRARRERRASGLADSSAMRHHRSVLTLPVGWVPCRFSLARFSSTTNAMKALVNEPQDRTAAARELRGLAWRQALGLLVRLWRVRRSLADGGARQRGAAAVAMATCAQWSVIGGRDDRSARHGRGPATRCEGRRSIVIARRFIARDLRPCSIDESGKPRLQRRRCSPETSPLERVPLCVRP